MAVSSSSASMFVRTTWQGRSFPDLTLVPRGRLSPIKYKFMRGFSRSRLADGRHRIDGAGKQNEFFYNRFHRHRTPSRDWAGPRWTITMRTIQKVAIASTIAFSALAFFPATASTAQAGPIVPPGHYCLAYAMVADCISQASRCRPCVGTPPNATANLRKTRRKPLGRAAVALAVTGGDAISNRPVRAGELHPAGRTGWISAKPCRFTMRRRRAEARRRRAISNHVGR